MPEQAIRGYSLSSDRCVALRGKYGQHAVVEARRVCREEGCTTVLSKYNQESLCYLHRPFEYVTAEGRRIPLRGRLRDRQEVDRKS